MSRNPYVLKDQGPTLRKSVFAFMDILGYSDLVLQAKNSGAQGAVLRYLHKALSESRHRLEGKDIPQMGEKDLFALKAFTDNIVISWPVVADAESELGTAFMFLAEFQFNMAIQGYFVRGAISVAPAYVDEIAVFGDALIEAYTAESKLARDPRIILTKSAEITTRQHLEYYHPSDRAPQVRDILKDSDGQWFLNYLETVLIAEHEHGPFYEEFLKHKEMVEKNLKDHIENPPVWAKYAWVAGYHNYFCDLHSHHFGDEHRVNIELYRATPSRIVDE